MKKIFNIFSASEYFGGYEKKDGDTVIAADGGLNTLKKINIKPDYIIGDFDSGNEPESMPHVKLPCEKDYTDTFYAVKIAIDNSADEIHIWGGTDGSRPEHTLANYQILAYLADLGIPSFLHGNGQTITAIKNSSIKLNGKQGRYISVFSISDKSDGVTIKGLKYQIENATLSNTITLGISNEFLDCTGEISVRNGTLLIFY